MSKIYIPLKERNRGKKKKKQRNLFLLENFWALLENGEWFVGHDIRIGIEEDIFNPTHITVWANSLAAIAKWIRRACPVFVRLRQIEEPKGLNFQPGYDLHWDSMIYKLENPKLLKRLDYEALGLRVWKVYHWNSSEQAGGLACFD